MGLGVWKSRSTLLLLFQACGVSVCADTRKQETKTCKAAVDSLTTFDLAQESATRLLPDILRLSLQVASLFLQS